MSEPNPRAPTDDPLRWQHLREGGRVLFAEGGPNVTLTAERARELVGELLDALGPLRRVLLLPPDITRRHSGAGELTCELYRRLAPSAEVAVLPALGTHAPMTAAEQAAMFPGIPPERFLDHDWRRGVTDLGEVPAELVRAVSGGRVNYPIRCEVASSLVQGGWDRILSVGQLVPHEVVGIAGHDKNLFVGAGGKDAIDRTHFLGAACGIETLLGRVDTPVRDVLRYMAAELARTLPVTHLMTVRTREADGTMITRGLFAGEGPAVFAAGAALAREVNLTLLDAPLPKVVVYLAPDEYRTTWLGNKAVYRTRMAIEDGGELLVLGPGIERFGEDPGIDALIRRHGYRGTPATLAAVEVDPELRGSLSAAAHLMHGASEGRFRVVYAAGKLAAEDLAAVGYASTPLDAALRRYDPARLAPGWNTLPDGEELFFVPNPAVGLWSTRARFAS